MMSDNEEAPTVAPEDVAAAERYLNEMRSKEPKQKSGWNPEELKAKKTPRTKCTCGNDSCKQAKRIKCTCRCHSTNHGSDSRKGMSPLDKTLGLTKEAPLPLGFGPKP